MLGSGAKAQAFFNPAAVRRDDAVRAARHPPGLAAAARVRLRGQGCHPRPDRDRQRGRGDGRRPGQLDRVILALGQMKAKGKVQGDEMLQLTESNIAAWQYLADFLGTDVPTAMKMVTKGLVTGSRASTRSWRG
jgi:tape measure domain-containing protein